MLSIALVPRNFSNIQYNSRAANRCNQLAAGVEAAGAVDEPEDGAGAEAGVSEVFGAVDSAGFVSAPEAVESADFPPADSPDSAVAPALPLLE